MTPDRIREIVFALALLLVPLAIVGAAELAWGGKAAQDEPEAFDWAALRQATMVHPEERYSLFRPGSAWGELSFNSHGMRSPEIPAEKPDGTIRLAFLGDSITMTAELAEAQSFAAQLTGLVQARYPTCRFDYLTFAGPSYSTEFIAEHWPDLNARFTPDIAVMILGSPFEVVRQIRPTDEDDAAEQGRRTRLKLALFKKLRHYQRRLSLDQFLPGLASEAVTEAGVDAALNRMRGAVAGMTGMDQTLLIGHRGRIRDDGPLLERLDQTRRLRRRLGKDSAIDAGDLLRRTLDEMAQTVRAHGGRFADAQLALPPDDVHYLDTHHLSAQGARALAEAVLPEIEAMLPTCGSSRSGS